MKVLTKKAELEIYPSGQKVWRNGEGQYHRADGFAIDYGNNSETYGYFENGKLKRIETPNRVRYFNEEGKEIVERSPITEKDVNYGEEEETNSGGTETEIDSRS
jgi:hypothetical protein